jgi:hypothetical protein
VLINVRKLSGNPSAFRPLLRRENEKKRKLSQGCFAICTAKQNRTTAVSEKKRRSLETIALKRSIAKSGGTATHRSLHTVQVRAAVACASEINPKRTNTLESVTLYFLLPIPGIADREILLGRNFPLNAFLGC